VLEAAARSFIADVWNGEREETAYDLIADECPGLGGTGPDATLAWHRDRRAAFPDLRYEVVEVGRRRPGCGALAGRRNQSGWFGGRCPPPTGR
jgi:hypothetical protein